MSRADIKKEKDRKDFFLYIDEFQNFTTDSFESIFSEARKYKLSLIVANQYISQVSEKIRNAIF
jgi:type IV secretory pathway TraG/TraD family ATPase VirD4